MASDPITSWQIDGETMETVTEFILGGSKITADGVCSHEIKRRLLLGRKVMTNLSSVQFSCSVVSNSLRPQELQHARPPCLTNLDSILKSRDITLPTKVPLVKASSHAWMWELDYKESWAPKKWCFWTVVLEKTLESPLDCKESQLVHPKGYQSWIFIGRTDAEAETPLLWPPDAKNWIIWKDLDTGKDWRQKERGMTEVQMVGWHHWLNGHEFE